jgi:hypothetical protein
MKKLLASILTLFVLTGSAWAWDPPNSPLFMGYSTVYTADQNAVYSGDSWLYGLVVGTDGTNSVTITVYDALTATGTKAFPDWVVTTSSSNRMSVISFDPPLVMGTGITVDITTGGTVNYVVYYRSR